MENSTELYQKYVKAKIQEERLAKINKGRNLLNADNFKCPYYISLNLEVRGTLLEMERAIKIHSNFPFSSWGYNDEGVKDFLKKFEDYLSIPRYKQFLISSRRKENKISDYSDSTPDLRDKQILFEDIDIQIGEEAQKELTKKKIDFNKSIKVLLLKQREATEEEGKDIEKFYLLLARRKDLRRQHLSKNYSAIFRVGKEADYTMPIGLSDLEYNEKLKEIKEDMEALCKKYSFFKLPNFQFVEIKEEETLESWKKENLNELEETWNNFDDDEKQDDYEGNFDKYVEMCFEMRDDEESSSHYSEEEEESDEEDY